MDARFKRKGSCISSVLFCIPLALSSCTVETPSTAKPSEGPDSTPVAVDEAELVSGTYTHAAMNTEFVFTLYGRPGDSHSSALEAIAQEAFAAIDDLESRLSSWRQSSQISKVNRSAGQEPVRVSADILRLVRNAKGLAEETEGSFDITVGPLLELWGLYEKEGRAPAQEEVAEVLQRVGVGEIVISPEEQTLYLKKKGMRLNFGGIGKGLALDVSADVLRSYGITRALLHGGTSTVVALGAPPGEDHWTVHIQDPYNQSQSIDTVYLRDRSLSTSGCYGEQLEVDGRTICHIIDPRTGYPVEGALSVSVVAPTGARSDGLSTGFMVWGKTNIEDFCRRHPEVGAIYVGVPETGDPVAVRINLTNERATK